MHLNRLDSLQERFQWLREKIIELFQVNIILKIIFCQLQIYWYCTVNLPTLPCVLVELLPKLIFEGWGKVIFSVCSHLPGGTPSQIWTGGYPIPGGGGGGVRGPDQMGGYPIQSPDGGYLSQVQTRVTPSQVWMWGVPILLMGATPSKVWMGGNPSCWWGYTIPGLDRGHPIPDPNGGYPILLMGYPHPRSGTPCPRLDGVPPIQYWMGTPRPRLDGIPPLSGDWSAKRTLATRWAMCLLRSRGRTFLLWY